ncbi:MAG: aminotransferase class III-fold pyridoxal phosphate-dependent enzyme [Dethiobacter sp.]|jgi:adenosylmethionine-8-amino-7-oxononanoate aminotransferase|nr:MAG: aminotransferase class III-fold pyridoxal phosphate-dependent enzyme [Dethiobacter sp.]
MIPLHKVCFRDFNGRLSLLLRENCANLVGFGRTGSWFTYQKHGVVPDIMTVAKGLVNSQVPGAAVIVNEEIADFIDAHRWNHVSTFSGHPIAMAAASATMEYMLKNNLKTFLHYIKDETVVRSCSAS